VKKKISLLLITIFSTALIARADFTMTKTSDYTGDAFFGAPKYVEETPTEEKSETSGTIPPLKKLRLEIREQIKKQNDKKYAPAPVMEEVADSDRTETSEYASKEIKNDFDEMSMDDIEPKEIKKEKKGFFKKKNKEVVEEQTEDIILDCDDIKYDTAHYLINARGNVVVTFVKQGTVVKSDIMTYDRANNTIKAEGNVQIIKNNQVTTGDYIFIDMNEENGLIENPLTKTASIEMRAKKGYAYGDKMVYEFGDIKVKDSLPLRFMSADNTPRLQTMLVPENEKFKTQARLGNIDVKAASIKITQKGDLETVALKKFGLYNKNKVLFKLPAVKIYTNKNHDYLESNIWEIGSYRGLGMYTGPGWVFELPKGSVLKAMPMINYNSGIGIGAVGRFSSGTNQTMAAYGSAKGKFIVEGTQKLDDNLQFLYGYNSYMDEWFLGGRRPKYGFELVYKKGYSSNNFMLKGCVSSYQHRLDAGYFHDLDFDNNYEGIHGENVATARFRYMANARQDFFNYKNPEKLTAFNFGVNGQLSAALYGTGDTQVIGRLGPTMHTQYKRWMQDITYFFAAIDDNTPMPVFDAYRHGSQNIYIREYLRLHRLLTVSWFGSFNMLGDTPDGKRFTENAFFVSVGPDDIKLSIGFDFIRQTLYCSVDFDTDAKGANISYDKLEIKQDKKASEDKKYSDDKDKAPMSPKALSKAVVEDVKDMENVL